jgi:hypothetical protein
MAEIVTTQHFQPLCSMIDPEEPKIVQLTANLKTQSEKIAELQQQLNSLQNTAKKSR